MKASILALLLLFSFSVIAEEQLPLLADVHVHYKWSQTEVTTPQQAVEAMQRNRVGFAIVFGTPPEIVLDVKEADTLKLKYFFQPYIHPFLKPNWFLNKRVPDAVHQALKSGQYHGVGEIHISDGIGPRMDNEVFNQVLNIAAEFNAPVNLHTNSSSYLYMQRICSKHTKTRFIWAHAGGLQAEAVAKVLATCSNVWVEFSARDHLKSVGGIPVADNDGYLAAGWLDLIKRYPTTFMMGSDPIWPITEIDSWHTDDTGWETVDEVYAYHRRWIKTLPQDLATKVRYQNAVDLFK